MVCPRCGFKNSDNEPICPICNHEIVSVKKEVVVKNDHLELKIALVGVIMVIIAGITIGIGMKFGIFSTDEKVIVEDAPLFINNIKTYINYYNTHDSIDLEKANVNMVKYKNYNYIEIPLSSICIYENNKWNNEKCTLFFEDLGTNFCKLPGMVCAALPDYGYFEFNDKTLTTNTKLEYNKIICSYDGNDTSCIRKK